MRTVLDFPGFRVLLLGTGMFSNAKTEFWPLLTIFGTGMRAHKFKSTVLNRHENTQCRGVWFISA
jgi:hypothetical protein